MEDYLNSTVSKLQSNSYESLTIVLGNESCDLDSAISSLVYAIFLHWQNQRIRNKVCTKSKRSDSPSRDLFLPVFNVDRADYDLKTEVKFAMKEKGIESHQLVFRNDVPFQQLAESNRVKVVLVDHHILAVRDKFFAPYVTEIIDHRPIDKAGWVYGVETRSDIEGVGSCCTLVGRRIREQAVMMGQELDVEFFNEYPACTDLLYSTIILDTVNFSKALNKGTPHDEEIVLFLEALLKPSDRECERKMKLDRLVDARKDVSSLSAAQLLRKDVKVFGHILVPSFPILVQDFFLKSQVKEALTEQMALRNCSIALLLGMDLQNGLKRDAAVYAVETEKAAQLSGFLENWTNPPLQLVPQDATSPASHCYRQLNLSATRKQYIPALNAFLDNKQ